MRPARGKKPKLLDCDAASWTVKTATAPAAATFQWKSPSRHQKPCACSNCEAWKSIAATENMCSCCPGPVRPWAWTAGVPFTRTGPRIAESSPSTAPCARQPGLSKIQRGKAAIDSNDANGACFPPLASSFHSVAKATPPATNPAVNATMTECPSFRLPVSPKPLKQVNIENMAAERHFSQSI